MVGTSKILTVSYGTFSCTLEGFDDSFETMKAIAEYFRNLAADDRYFGAEPPTPDAEMLARIAEREIARRVEAREQEGRIYLRAAEDAGATVAREQTATKAEKEAEARPETRPEPETPPKTPPETPEVAEEAPPEVADEAQEAVDAAQELPQVEPEATPEPAPIAAPEPAETAGDAQEFAAAGPEEEPAEVIAEETEEAVAAAPEEAEDVTAAPVEPADEDDSVAARLRRIRSVVARSDSYGADDYSEDEHAQDFLDRTAAELDATLTEDAESEAAEAADVEDESDFLADFNAQLAKFAEQAEQTPDEIEQGEKETDQLEQAEQPPVSPEPAGKTAQAQEPDISEDTLAQLLYDAMPDEGTESRKDAAETEEAPARDTEEPLVLTNAEQVDKETEPDRPLRARVVKMKRSEFEAAVAEGRLDEDFDGEIDIFDDAERGHDDDQGEAILSPEDEADLQRELAEVEAELARPPEAEPAAEPAAPADTEETADEVTGEETAGPVEQAEEEETPEHAEGRAPRAADRLQEAAEESSRLFDAADTHFEAPEATRRRNAIQHLRAAVAATKAERRAGGTLEQDTNEDAYRSDLASVVRPRRPRTQPAESDEGRSRRPADERQAPLKLVAEQRVDTPREPVRPRRVSSVQVATEAAPAGTEGGFTEFAEKTGATTLTELLEAAAAYMADVEGRQQFSRPMLMGKLKEVEKDTFSREDGLRSFGHLLREGKLQKVRGGRFTVTDQTEYRAQAARQAG